MASERNQTLYDRDSGVVAAVPGGWEWKKWVNWFVCLNKLKNKSSSAWRNKIT